MDKQTIVDLVFAAILEVSPYAADNIRAHDISFNEKLCLVDLGLNSIDYAQIMTILMERLHIHQPLDVFNCTNNIYELVDILCHFSRGAFADKHLS